MDIGIVGTGWVTGAHLNALKQISGVKVTGIAGRNTARAKELALQAATWGPEPKVWDDGLAMVKQGRFDAVLVLLPPHLHGDLELEIARRVPAVLIEKPIGLDLKTVEGIADAFDKAGTLVSAGYMNRYRNTTAKVKELLSPPHSPPVLIQGWWVGEMPPPLWWRTHSQSGGQFVEQCTHLVDLARWVAGEVAEVSAFSTKGFVQGIEGYTVDDAMTVNLRFVSGALGNFTTGCFARAPLSTGKGTHGVGMTFSSRTTQCTLTDWAMDLEWKDESRSDSSSFEGDIFLTQNKAFIEAATTGNKSVILSPYRDAIQTLRVTLAAADSARKGTTISLK